MINLDTRLINTLDGNELAIFCHLIKRIGKNNECFPSRALLMKETGFGRDRVKKSIKSLTDKKIIEHFQKKTEIGQFSKTHYRLKTTLASVFINVENEELLNEKHRDTENRSTENPSTENPQLSINHKISINKKEDIIDFKGLLKFINTQTGRNFRVINKSIENKFKARLKDGYKKQDIINSIINASKNKYHKENGGQYLTPDFFSRASTLDKYGFAVSENKKDEVDIKKALESDTHVNF